MKRSWFRRWGWIHRPVSWEGGAVVALALIFCVQVFAAIDRHSHSASDTLNGVFPYFVCVFLLIEWIASKTSGRT